MYTYIGLFIATTGLAYVVKRYSSVFMTLNNKYNVFVTRKPLCKKRYIVSYTYKGNPYKLLFRTKRGPMKIQSIYNGDNDVTDIVKQYLGPNEDCHGLNVTPHDIGYDGLIFKLFNGEERLISDKEFIKV